ncbi:hypothetical protein HHI36_011064 [Cryptolaemus montrouzieri]|uniref:Translation initiation factor eIF2B subunit delta n=1 Tax=Cryptolaemus montrouzieri TaxID=559131 RepID=A0ABD2MKZ4_9CUCU
MGKDGLSKAEQKVKRRELQEAQRLAKLKSDPQNSKNIPKSNEGKANPKITSDSRSEIPRQVKSKVPNESKKSPNISKTPLAKKCLHGNKVKLLNHLYIGDSKSFEFEDSICLPNIHPAFIQLGIQYSTKTIMGSNARCISLLSALTHLIRDLRSPPEQEFCRFLESVLQNSSDYLQKCRPMAVSMINALRLFKLQLTQIDTNIPDDDKKQKLIEFVDTYI